MTVEAEGRVMPLLAWKVEEGREPRDAGGFQKLEKAREWILP